MSDYPLIVSIAKNTRVALSGYEQRKQAAIFGVALTSLLIIVYCGLLVRRNEKSMKLTEAVQQEKDRLSSLINSISDEVWFADAEKNFALANPAAVQEFGVEYASSAVERLAASVEVLRADGSPRPVEEAPPLRALEGEVVRNQLEIVRSPATGEVRYREVNANPVRDSGGNIIGSVSVVRDITDRKLAEERTLKLSSELADNYCRLQELNATLEEEILERQTAQEELVAVNQRLEAASRAKSSFLANMSHELRTPLNAIIGFSEVLKDKIFGPLNTKQTTYVDNVVVSGQHLLSLVNDLLDLSKAEAGKMELERSGVNIKKVCQGSIDLLRDKARKRKVRLSFAADKTVDDVILFADERKIKQILYNLIDNGIKYNKSGGSVAVTATKIASGDQTSAIQIVVEDTGIGITSENLALLFNPFCQLSRNHTEPAEGAGLGLALTKRLVELHGGEIRVESELDKWSRFSVWIPIQEESA
jgi:PAS domain S-box-containing protein